MIQKLGSVKETIFASIKWHFKYLHLKLFLYFVSDRLLVLNRK